MMNKANKEMIFEGLENGAQALRMMLGSEAKLSNVDFYIPKTDGEIQYVDTGDHNVHLLRTDVVGEFTGVSFLMLKTIDVYKIHQKCLPKSVVDKDNHKNRALKGGVLLELDNIVSAAVVTVFSDHIESSIYGDVPKLKVINGKHVNTYLTNEFLSYGESVNVRAILQVEDLDMELIFVWILENSFFE